MNKTVLIIGAGPTGLMAANLLAQSGVDVLIIDKNANQAHESRALGIQPRTLELLHNIGLVEPFLKRGMVTVAIQLYVNGKRKGQITFKDLGRSDTPYPFILMLSQAETESILNENLEAKGVHVQRGVEATQIEQLPDKVKVTVQTSNGTEMIEAAYVIGADGAHSIVRKLLGLSFHGAPYPQDFALGDVKVDWPLDHDKLCVFLHGKSFGAFFPMKQKDGGRVLAINPNKQQLDGQKIGSVPITLNELQFAFSKVTHMPTHLSNPTWLARFHIHHRGVDRYRVGRIFVAGDAAHIHSPVGAQGMNTGLQDVANLCWKLTHIIKYGATDPLLETYQKERWPIGQKLLNFTDRFFQLIATQNSFLVIVRDLIFIFLARVAFRFKAMRYRGFNFVSQLGIRYHSNPFIQGKKIVKLAPGRRAPNAKISNETDIFDLITGYRFHLLVISRSILNKEEKETLRQMPEWVKVHLITSENVRKEDVYHVYGVTESSPTTMYLIRPDGYIAFATDKLDMQAAKSLISRFGPIKN